MDRNWIYLCGDWWETDGIGGQQNQRNVNRFAPATGAVDPDFWIATDGGVQACALDPDLGVLFVGGHFDCVRAWTDSTTPADPNPAQCGSDALFVGTLQRDLFALSVADGDLLPWNPDTAARRHLGDRARRRPPPHRRRARLAPHRHHHTPVPARLPSPLFADGFEAENSDRWSATFPPD